MRIKDSKGRIGDITEQRDNGVFAKPEGIHYATDDTQGVIGAPGAKLITATYWRRQPDGTYRGLWFDSPVNAFETATIIETEETGATKQFPVILPADMHETLRRISFERKISMAEIIRQAVVDWLEKQG